MRSLHTGRVRVLSICLACILFLSPVIAEPTYTVRSGDTLGALAKKFSITLDELLTLNTLSNPDALYIGQVLKLPAHARMPEPPKAPPVTEPAQPAPVVQIAHPAPMRQLGQLTPAPQPVHPALQAMLALPLPVCKLPQLAPAPKPIQPAPKPAPVVKPAPAVKPPPAVKPAPVAPVVTPPERPLTGRALVEERTRLVNERIRAQAVTDARQYIGTPYRWGGQSSRGFDCSGLVMHVFGHRGLRLPHNAAAMSKCGTRVSFKALQPGDLVFFNTGGRGISHVGIWVGNNSFIHSSTSRGVVTDKLVGYYAKRLVSACRL